jgi:transposase
MQIDLSSYASLSRAAKTRVRWMQHFMTYRSARLTCRHFGISPSTFYHWKKKFDPSCLITLEDRASRKPKNKRRPKWNGETLLLIERFISLNQFVKHKRIQEFLAAQGVQVSASTVSRMLKQLRQATKKDLEKVLLT